MTNRTRFFVIASLLVLGVGLAAGFAAYYLGMAPWRLGRGEPAELHYISDKAALVAYVNVQDLMRSEVRQRLRQAVPALADGQRQFLDLTGIDIERDIDHVVACLEPKPGSGVGGLLMARGRFDVARVEASMKGRGGSTAEDYKGKRLIVTPAQLGDADGFALSFVEPGLVAVGSTQMVRGAIDREATGDAVKNDSELMTSIRAIEPGSGWVVGRLDALRPNGRLPFPLADELPPITWFSVSGRVDSAIRGTARAETRDEASARELLEVMRGAVALAKLQARRQPEMQALAQSLGLTAAGRTVTLTFAVPGDALPLVGRGAAQGLRR